MGKTLSLKKNKDFQFVYQNGRSCANRYLVLRYTGNNEGKNRLGVSVSKKVGNSVVRHRLKRLVKESCRIHEEELEEGLDMVVIIRPSAAEIGFREMERALLNLVKRAGLSHDVSENGK